MSERIERFEIEGAPRLSARIPTGDLRIVPGQPGAVVVRLRGRDRDLDRYLVEDRGSTVTVEPERGQMIMGSVGIIIEVGEPAVLTARMASADLSVETELAELTVDTASGDVRTDAIAAGVKAKSASGDLRFGAIGGRLAVATAAGDVFAPTVSRSVDVKSASGDVRLGSVGGDVSTKTAAGDVRIGRFAGDDLDVKTLSGDVSVGVIAGRRFRVSFTSLSGDIHSEFPVSEGSEGGPARLTVRTMSGDITIEPAD